MSRSRVGKREVAHQAPAVKTTDSFQNMQARLGYGANNQTSDSTYGFNPISRNRTLLEFMYRGSWMVGVAVDCVADDMTRAGIDFGSTLEPKLAEKLQSLMCRLLIWQKLNETIKWARLYGGAIAVMLIDGQQLDTPLNEKAIGNKQFKGLLVLDRWMVQPSLSTDGLVTEFGPNLGLPKFYTITANAPALSNQKVHYTRVLRMDGVNLPYWQKLAENLWGLSIVERLYDRLIAFDSSTTGAAQLVYKAYLRTVKIEGLREIISAGGKAFEALGKNLEFIRATQSNEGLTVLDAKDEMSFQSYTFAGLSDLLTQFGQQISGAVQIPLVRLFGQSPTGMNSTGESDLRNYYDGIREQQEGRLREPLTIMLQILAQSEGITLPEGFNYEFASLWQMSDKEKADVASSVTSSVVQAHDAGIISTPIALQELRQSSAITGIWSNITNQDIEEAKAEPPMPDDQPAGA